MLSQQHLCSGYALEQLLYEINVSILQNIRLTLGLNFDMIMS